MAATESARLHLGLAAVAFVPLLLTQRQWVGADTKTYLYLDPARLLGRAWSMWDPTVGFGTVTHQNIGYLWPMGPFYWLLDTLGVPDWVAQRLWWGTLIFAAGTRRRLPAAQARLERAPGWSRRRSSTRCSPYLLTLVARLSGILLPYAALPWLIAFTVLDYPHQGWRYPALFALMVATCGSINATALLLVGVGAGAVAGARRVGGAGGVAAARSLARRACASACSPSPLSLWWIAGLCVQGTNGIEILRYTETAKTVAAVSVSHEVLRGLGYWFFYGSDRLGPWIEPSVAYTQSLPLIGAHLLHPRPRAWSARSSPAGGTGPSSSVLLVWHGPGRRRLPVEGQRRPVGRAVKAFLESDGGLAMRVAAPGRAARGARAGRAARRGPGQRSSRRWPPASARPSMLVAVAAGRPGHAPAVDRRLRAPRTCGRDDIPEYWDEAADHVDAGDHQTRVLEVPGTDFASYRWGNTVDPIPPGLIDRPYVARELIPYGSPASADLLNAFDLPLQERTADPDAVAPIARLMRVGDVARAERPAVRALQHAPAPSSFWDSSATPPGSASPSSSGRASPTRPSTTCSSRTSSCCVTDPSLPDPPEVACFPVEDPLGHRDVRSRCSHPAAGGRRRQRPRRGGRRRA